MTTDSISCIVGKCRTYTPDILMNYIEPLVLIENSNHSNSQKMAKYLANKGVFDIFSLVKFIRKEANLTKQQFSDVLGVKKSYFESMESGINPKSIKPSHLEVFAMYMKEDEKWVIDIFFEANKNFNL